MFGLHSCARSRDAMRIGGWRAWFLAVPPLRIRLGAFPFPAGEVISSRAFHRTQAQKSAWLGVLHGLACFL